MPAGLTVFPGYFALRVVGECLTVVVVVALVVESFGPRYLCAGRTGRKVGGIEANAGLGGIVIGIVVREGLDGGPVNLETEEIWVVDFAAAAVVGSVEVGAVIERFAPAFAVFLVEAAQVRVVGAVLTGLVGVVLLAVWCVVEHLL